MDRTELDCADGSEFCGPGAVQPVNRATIPASAAVRSLTDERTGAPYRSQSRTTARRVAVEVGTDQLIRNSTMRVVVESGTVGLGMANLQVQC